jgi:hypothetical protein
MLSGLFMAVTFLLSYLIAHSTVAFAPPFEGRCQDRHLCVYVVVDLNFIFICVAAMNAAHVLLNDAFPTNGKGKKEGVELGVIESFADELPRSKQHGFVLNIM